VVLGDAVCSFNPVYGQGMTAAALEAETLDTMLHQQRERRASGDITGFSRRFQKKITHIVDTFWLLAASEDFRHPETQGKRPLGVNLLNRYAHRVHELSTFDPQVTVLLYQVLQAIKSPMALFSPRILAKVLFKRAPRQSHQEGTSASREVSGDDIPTRTWENKDMVIRGGESLFPGEIEELLIRHPKVADVQVVGVPDAFFGEELLAVVIPKQGEQLSERELRTYCKGQISHQKIPRYFQFVTSYPLTGSGKVQKFVLRENAIKAWDLEILKQK
jgi:hypothetical protein